MADKTKALAKMGETGFAIIEDPTAHEIMLGAFDSLGLSGFQLSRIKIPAGGGIAWEVETAEGSEICQHLDVVILAIVGKQKSWWASPMEEGGGGSPPSCTSSDGRTGYGHNTVDGAASDAPPASYKCAECPWDRFESSRSGGRGKDCKDFSLLFFFPKSSRLPSLLVVPATSGKVLTSYMIKLIEGGKAPESAITRLGLKKAQSQSGITYSVLDLSWVADLDADAGNKMREVSKDFKARIQDFDAFAQPDDN